MTTYILELYRFVKRKEIEVVIRLKTCKSLRDFMKIILISILYNKLDLGCSWNQCITLLHAIIFVFVVYFPLRTKSETILVW